MQAARFDVPPLPGKLALFQFLLYSGLRYRSAKGRILLAIDTASAPAD